MIIISILKEDTIFCHECQSSIKSTPMNKDIGFGTAIVND